MDALDAVVFSVVALEAFINESVDLATQFSKAPKPSPPEPPAVATFASIGNEVQKSRGSLALKFMVARFVLTGKTYDKGAAPYQDFDTLVEVRNAIVHYRSRETIKIEEDGEITFNPTELLDQLRSKSVLAEPKIDAPASWINSIATSAMARWACKSAAAMVNSLLRDLPPGSFKDAMELLYGQNFTAPE